MSRYSDVSEPSEWSEELLKFGRSEEVSCPSCVSSDEEEQIESSEAEPRAEPDVERVLRGRGCCCCDGSSRACAGNTLRRSKELSTGRRVVAWPKNADG